MKFQKGDIVSPGDNQYRVVQAYRMTDGIGNEKEYVDLIEIPTGCIFKKIYDPDLKLIKRKKSGHHLTTIFK